MDDVSALKIAQWRLPHFALNSNNSLPIPTGNDKWRYQKVPLTAQGPMRSLTAVRRRCLQPQVSLRRFQQTCPSKNWICSSHAAEEPEVRADGS
jgi:hypothetical protein